MGKLDGRVAVVTGGASGLGRASATLFAAEGATVVIADLNLAGAQATAAAIGPTHHAEALDVTDEAATQRVMQATKERFGRLDILMTCAGVGDSAPLPELDGAAFARTIQINLTGTFLSAKYAFEQMQEAGGSIITLGSVAGILATTGFASYGASKAAVIHLTRIMALEGAPHKIRVNAICPSWIWTPMVEKAAERLVPGAAPEIVQGYFARQAPLKRMGEPEDVARAALFLASDDSAFMTGQSMVLDGGMTLGSKPV
jgi:NAD(P)-dependent dehydrogenase (short-subunit alcohol dehydrogenase family)